MATTKPPIPTPDRWYHGDKIPMSAIRKFARQVAERFQPEKIILFGSYAYGTPHPDSDVDILVIMPGKRGRNHSVDIRMAFPTNFAMDLLVRTPAHVGRALADGEHFMVEITSRGKVLYDEADSRLGSQGRGRLHRRRKAARLQASGS